MMEEKEITIIPPNPKHDRHVRVEEKQLKVAAYCRISTRFEQQENSYEAQVKYYSEKIASNPNWSLAGIYADQGKPATSTKQRDSFNDMITGCYDGKIDMILTKSISRFARNTVDFLRTIRELKERQIRIVFEKENIDTMESTGELLITILSSQAQEESRNLSENTRWGIARKFEQGIVHVNHTKFMGYAKDLNGNLVIVPEEAEIVRKVFDLYLSGFGHFKIARILEQEEIKTVTGNRKWQGSVICKMLSNEKYKGDLLLDKSFTVDPISKRRLENMGAEEQYYLKNHHEPIVSEEIWDKAKEIREERYRINNTVVDGTRMKATRKYALSSMCECGFCWKYLFRRSHNQDTHNKKPVWKCRTATNVGSAKCPNSKAIDEVIIENAFLEMFNLPS